MLVKTLNKNAKGSFKILAGINRPITPSHVTKLATSINKMGVIRPIVVATMSFITGKKEKYIIDGQHLFHALMRAGMDFPYIEIEINSAEELVEKIALLNASSKSWSSIDYVTAWKAVNPVCAIIERLYNTYDLELLQIIELCATNTLSVNFHCGGNVSFSRIMKKGQATLRSEKYVVDVLDKITDILKIVPRMDRVSNKIFVASYVQFYQNVGGYEHEPFLMWLKANKNKFVIATQDPNEVKKLLYKSVN